MNAGEVWLNKIRSEINNRIYTGFIRPRSKISLMLKKYKGALFFKYIIEAKNKCHPINTSCC